jgi:predicted phosphodiesterase
MSSSLKEQMKEINALRKSLPKGESEKVEDYYLPKSQRRVLMLSDVHLPFQCDEALFAAIEYGKKKDVDTIYLNGDTMDMYQLSRFNKDPRQRDFAYELDLTRTFLKGLRDIFPKALIIFKISNHENRYEHFLHNKAVELLNVEEFKLPILLKLAELGIQVVEDKQLAHIGELKVLHGHELPLKSGGVNPARAVFLKTGESVIFGHFHRKSEHVERTLSNKLIKVYSTGCLADLSPGYMPYNSWTHGFAYIEVEKSGSYRVFNHTIIDGVVY